MKIITIAAMLIWGTAIAGSIDDELDEQKVNYIMDDVVIYLLDDTDPRTVCEMLDSHPGSTVEDVFNVKTLVSATCAIPK